MIPRYSRPEMAEIWSDTSRFQIWLQVETLALEGMVKAGLAPQDALDAVRERGAFNTERVLEIESEVKHDVIAFLTNVSENVGPEGRYLHRGMTSSDLLDTAFAVQLKRSGELITQELKVVIQSLVTQAKRYKKTPCIGRSHGIHAEPLTFGLKLLSFVAEFKRHEKRLSSAIEEISVGQISGAVGNYASVPPEIESYVIGQLDLKAETVPTQIIPRDRHAVFFNALALLLSSVERFCVEIRHLQRTEVREVEEAFSKGQKGSSAMPHKKNPILTENMTGFARLVRGYAISAMENVALWHERDISHSSVERVIAPDACILTDFLLHRLNSVVKNLVVHEEQMLKNLNITRGLIFSGTLLIALTDAGIKREDAYRLIQKHALPAWEGGKDFQTRVKEDPEICKAIVPDKLNDVFNLDRHLAHIDFIFERTLKFQD